MMHLNCLIKKIEWFKIWNGGKVFWTQFMSFFNIEMFTKRYDSGPLKY